MNNFDLKKLLITGNYWFHQISIAWTVSHQYGTFVSILIIFWFLLPFLQKMGPFHLQSVSPSVSMCLFAFAVFHMRTNALP